MTPHFFPILAVGVALVISGCTNTAPPVAQLTPPADCGASLLQEKMQL